MEHIRSKQADSIVHMDDAMADMVKGAAEAKDDACALLPDVKTQRN